MDLNKKYAKTIDSVNKLVDDGVVPGVSCVLFDGDDEAKIVKGEAEIKPEKEPLRDGMLYDVASLTKVVGTVPVICQLVNEGRIILDFPVHRYLPGFTNEDPTLRNLITHTSGIGGYIPRRNEMPKDLLTAALLTQLKVGPNLNRMIKYTDIGFIYLGWIAEAVTGKPIQQLITERVLKPLKMEHSTFTPDPQDCVPTSIDPKRGLLRGKVHDPKAAILGDRCGSAGLFTNLADLEKFSRALIETDLDDNLEPWNVDDMFEDQTPLDGDHSRSLGWKLLHSRGKDSHLLISHTGYTGTWMILDRETDSGFILLSNRVHPTNDNQEFLDRRARIFATYLNEKQ